MYQAVLSRVTSFTKAASICTAAVGVSVLVGWLVNVSTLKTILPGLSSMKPNTAICIIFLAVSLWQLGGHSLRLDKVQSALVGYACAGLALSISSATLGEYLLGWNFGVDQLLFRDLATDGHSLPGRMAPHTAAAFLILACALLLSSVETKSGFRPGQLLAVIPAMISLAAVAGYLYSVVSFYRIASYTGMALHTAVVLFLLSAGVIFTPPDRGIAAIVTTKGLGGVVVRRLLPSAFLVPLGIGWIRMEGQKAGLYGTEVGLALMVTVNVAIFSVLIYLSGVQVERIEEAQHVAEQGVLELNYTLKALVDVFPLPVIVLDPDAKIRIWNDASERVFGWPWLQVTGKTNPLVPDDKLAEFQSMLDLLETGDSISGMETELSTMDDIRIPVVLWAAPIDIGKRGFSGSILIIDGMSKRKQLESQMRETWKS
jgi:PAS domain S-box-containing protein